MESILLVTLSVLLPVQHDCLAKNIYFEARNQSETGMIAVSHVVLNRVESPEFPDDICDVVTQAKIRSDGSLIRHKCQFSWYCDGLSDYPREKVAWKHAKEIADDAYRLHTVGFDITQGSTYYHAKNVNPHWASAFERVVDIDDHIFYRDE